MSVAGTRLCLALLAAIGPLCFASVQIETLTLPEGCTQTAAPGDHLMLRYVVTNAAAGNTLYTTAPHQQIHLLVGSKDMSPSWNTGVEGMCLGETRMLTFPVETMEVGLQP